MCLYFKQNYGNMRCDGGTARPLDLGGSSYTGGGLGKYSGGGNSGKKSPKEEEVFRQLLESTNIQKEGDNSSLSSLSGGYPGKASRPYSSSKGSTLFWIGLVFLLLVGLVLNYIFHFELWMIIVILVVISVAGIIAAMILN
jgi:hypothetical protein